MCLGRKAWQCHLLLFATVSAPAATVANVLRPQDMTMTFTPVAAISAPVATVTNVPRPQDLTMPFTPAAAISAPVATVTNVSRPQDLATGIRVTPLITSATTIQMPTNMNPIQTMMTTPTAALVENIRDTTQTPTSSKTSQSEGELVETEIIDENTDEKVVMMLSPGQVAQLRAGAMEVLPQGTERQVGDHRTTNGASGQIYDQFQETPKVRNMETVKEMRQTHAVRDKDGNMIGVQVSPRNPYSATTRKQLLPRKSSVGTLPAVTLPVFGVSSVNQSNTETSISSQGGVPPEVVRMNVSGLPVEHASEESESETPMYCDGANDEKPKKKKMRLSGPACAQLRRSTRSTPTREVSFQKKFLL